MTCAPVIHTLAAVTCLLQELPKPTNESDPELKNAFIQLTCPSDDFRLT